MVGEANTSSSTREERRSSFGRTCSKFKDAVRRRSLGGSFRKPISEEPTSNLQATSSAPANEHDTVLSPLEANDTTLAKEEQIMDTTNLNEDDLVVDDNQDGDQDSSGGPLHSLRNRIYSSRARSVFDKYGIKYEEAPKDQTDGSKRVEKAIRIRIHWECHECKSSFSGRRTCAKCGHKRCPECPRSPAKRVKEVLGGTEVMQEIEEKAEKAPESKDEVVVPISTGEEAAATEAPAETTKETADRAVDDDAAEEAPLEGKAAEEALPEIYAEGTLEKDETGADGEVDVIQYQYSIQTRPRAGVQLVLRPKARYIRRTCHECQTNFTPNSRHKCLNCGHDRCKQCPREPVKTDNWSEGDTKQSEGAQRMVGTVERVYKKPRQRIRWACHQCETFFKGGAACTKCGHARCEKCPRSPLARVAPAEPDAALLASVAEKLASLKGPSSEPIVIAT